MNAANAAAEATDRKISKKLRRREASKKGRLATALQLLRCSLLEYAFFSEELLRAGVQRAGKSVESAFERDFLTLRVDGCDVR